MPATTGPLVSPQKHPPVRILLVDDNPANLLALEVVLEPLRQELVSAHSGREALEKLEQQEFALVLMDVHMPGLDGFQTVEAIRKRDTLKHLPVVFLTAMYKDKESAARGYSLGAADFITKPFEEEIVRAKVGAFVVLHQHNEAIKRHERRLAEEVAARKQAEAASRAREEFVAILGHDLRNPLMSIAMATQKHAAELAATAACRETSRHITTTVYRMNRLIEIVLDLARSRLGSGIPIEPRPADMALLCRASIHEIQISYPDCRISFEETGDLRGEWDPDRVSQVFANLLDNAIKHGTRSAGVRVRLRGDDAIVMTVHNSGAIPPERMARLFEPFQRGQHPEGLGLGLYIVHQIVRAHGATITATSTPAEGTLFTVTWPRRALRTATLPGERRSSAA